MFEVELKSVGNPDYGQDANSQLPGCNGDHRVSCATLEECAEECVKFIERNNLGGGNWGGGAIFNCGEQIARVSYNGRIWVKDSEGQFELPYDGCGWRIESK